MGENVQSPLKYRKAQNILNIVHGVGLLWKINPLTLNHAQGLYARVPVEVDLAHLLPDKLLISRKNKAGKVEEDFFVPVSYESLRNFCMKCETIGHDIAICRKLFKEKDRIGQARHVKVAHTNSKSVTPNQK